MAENKKEYKANFLWPHEDGSVEQLGYEFANAKSEPYRKEIWNEIIKRLERESQNAEQSTDPAVSLSGVNNRRELLIANYTKFINNSTDEDIELMHKSLDDFLSNL